MRIKRRLISMGLGGAHGKRSRIWDSCTCHLAARAALDLGNNILPCRGSIAHRGFCQHHLFGNAPRRGLPPSLADLLGHHGGYFKSLRNRPCLGGYWELRSVGAKAPPVRECPQPFGTRTDVRRSCRLVMLWTAPRR